MVFKKCDCGNSKFITTKTVYHELTVSINDGELIDGDTWMEQDHQPDDPYSGYFACTKCLKTYSYDEMQRD